MINAAELSVTRKAALNRKSLRYEYHQLQYLQGIHWTMVSLFSSIVYWRSIRSAPVTGLAITTFSRIFCLPFTSKKSRTDFRHSLPPPCVDAHTKPPTAICSAWEVTMNDVVILSKQRLSDNDDDVPSVLLLRCWNSVNSTQRVSQLFRLWLASFWNRMRN